jgi:hypothetical protein
MTTEYLASISGGKVGGTSTVVVVDGTTVVVVACDVAVFTGTSVVAVAVGVVVADVVSVAPEEQPAANIATATTSARESRPTVSNRRIRTPL